MSELSVFTLNCWAIGWGISADRVARIEAIAHYLSSCLYDIVLLQELWVSEDFDSISNATRSVLPYSHYFDAGFIGTGTCVLSKHPIQDVTFHEFSLNGYPHKILHGDWFAGKGVGLCQILFEGKIVNVYTSHYHAEYCRSQDMYLYHRIVQAVEAAQWIKLTSAGADLTIYAGDFNTEPIDPPYLLLRHITGLGDAWSDTHCSISGADGKEGKGAKLMAGETNGTPFNSYTSSQERSECPYGKRIDYILYMAGQQLQASAVDCQLPLSKKVPASFTSKQVSYSDHEAVSAVLKLEHRLLAEATRNVPSSRQMSQEGADCLQNASSLIDKGISETKTRGKLYSYACIACLLLLAFTCTDCFEAGNILGSSASLLLRSSVVIVGVYSFCMATILNWKERRCLTEARSTLQLLLSNSKLKSVVY